MKTIAKTANFIRALISRELKIEFEMTPVVLHSPSISKMKSLIQTEFNQTFPGPRVSGLPSVLQIEPTNICSLKCPLCPSGRRALSRNRGFMSPGIFEKLMDELGRTTSLVILWGWGEPLQHPCLPEMIKIAKSHNTAVITSTNGQHMDYKLADRLVESGLDSIIVALDGATDESYESYRAGGSLQKVLDTLDMLYYAKASRNSKTPLVNLRMVVTKDNEHEVPLMRDIAVKHNADMLAFRGVAMTELWDDQKDDWYIPKEQSYSMYKYDNGTKVMGFYRCRRPWKRATIAWDGTFVPCEMDYSNSAAYGTFPDDGPAAAIWNGSRARRFRRRFLNNRMQFEFCGRCSHNDRMTEDITIKRIDLKAK